MGHRQSFLDYTPVIAMHVLRRSVDKRLEGFSNIFKIRIAPRVHFRDTIVLLANNRSDQVNSVGRMLGTTRVSVQ